MKKKVFTMAAVTVLAAGCAVQDASEPGEQGEPSAEVEQAATTQKSKTPMLKAPAVYPVEAAGDGGGYVVDVCASSYDGMPAGFTVQWADSPPGGDYEFTWPKAPCDDGFNKMSLSWNEEHQGYCARVVVGKPYQGLEGDACAAGISCGDLHFRAFAQANKTYYASPWSETARDWECCYGGAQTEVAGCSPPPP